MVVPNLKTRTIIKKFKGDEALTFKSLANEYNMAEEEFLPLMKKVVGNDNFRELEKINNKRMKKKLKGKEINKTNDLCKKTNDEEENDMKARLGSKEIRPKKVSGSSMSEKIMETLLLPDENISNAVMHTVTLPEKVEENVIPEDSTKESRQELVRKLRELEERISFLNNEKDKLTDTLIKKEEQISSLKEEVSTLSHELNEKESLICELSGQKEKLQEKISQMEIIYLVAPKYKGTLKKGKKYISTVSTRQEVEVEDICEEDYISHPTYEFMINSGFDSMNAFKEAFKFTQLVLKYQLEEKNIEVLCNNPLITKMIEDVQKL